MPNNPGNQDIEFKAIISALQGDDKKLLSQALDFATQAHLGQTRKSGEPFICHPIQVAISLWEKFNDPLLTAAGLLHDAVEDNPDISRKEIHERFGDVVGFLVDAVTKGEKDFYKFPLMTFNDKLTRLLWAGSNRVEVLLLKLADREHNLETICHLPDDKQVRMSFETQAIFKPLLSILDYKNCSTIPQDQEKLEAYLKRHGIKTAPDFKEHLVSIHYASMSAELFDEMYEFSNKILWEIDDMEYFEKLCRNPKLSKTFNIIEMHSDGKSQKAVFQFHSSDHALQGSNTKMSPKNFSS